MLTKLIRFFSPRKAQRLELGQKEKATRPAAYIATFEIASLVGPLEIAHEQGFTIETLGPIQGEWLTRPDRERVASAVAKGYHDKARDAAFDGTMAGFEAWGRVHGFIKHSAPPEPMPGPPNPPDHSKPRRHAA